MFGTQLHGKQLSSYKLQVWLIFLAIIQTHGSESRGQGGSSKRHPGGLETHACEYFTGTRAVKIENAITKEP